MKPRVTRLPLLIVVLIYFLVPTLSQADVAIPTAQGRLTDLTGTLPIELEADLEARLDSFAKRTGAQLVGLIVPSTKPETVDAYAMRVVETWKPGQKGKDNGVLLLVAKDDRALRIEVGRGLEGTLTDVTARRIIDEAITPAFRRGEFGHGVSLGIDRIMSVVEGTEWSAPPDANRSSEEGNWDQAIFLAFAGWFSLIFVAGVFWPRRSSHYAVGGSSSWDSTTSSSDSDSSSSFDSGGDFGGGGASGSW